MYLRYDLKGVQHNDIFNIIMINMISILLFENVFSDHSKVDMESQRNIQTTYTPCTNYTKMNQINAPLHSYEQPTMQG